MDYAQIEAQALSIVQATVPEVEDWTRAWTNAGRREVQRLYNFPEMLAFYPTEANLGTQLTIAAGERRVTLPTSFKEFYSKRGDLWYRDAAGSLVPLELLPFESIIARFGYDDEASEPEVFHLVREQDGQTVHIDVFPKATATVELQCYAYFYLPALADPANVSGVEDFLSRQDPLLVRDFVTREAYLALEMYDAAAQVGQALASRGAAIVADAKKRELAQSDVLRPSLRSGERGSSRRAAQGYPFWGRW